MPGALLAGFVLAAALTAPAKDAPPPGPLPKEATTPTAAFDAGGRLWLAWVEGTHVQVSVSEDLGRTFRKAVAVNRDPEPIDANGESRPKIAVGRGGEIFVSYTRKGSRPYTGDVRFTRSTDDGTTFSTPVTVNDDGKPTGHRFEAVGVGPDGKVHVFWIDKRDKDAADAEKRVYAGAALYHAWSADGGKTFSANRKLKDNVCECCRLAVGFHDAVPVVLWRDIFPNGARDHAFMRVEGDAPSTHRVAFDDWKIAGCPHHGPALAIGADGTLHASWFTGAGVEGAGTFYARSTDGGRTWSDAVRLGSLKDAGRPQVAVAGASVFLLWREGAGAGAVVGITSRDGGKSWTPGQELARTAGSRSDHPLLVPSKDAAYLSWLTDEGYRLVPFTSPRATAP